MSSTVETQLQRLRTASDLVAGIDLAGASSTELARVTAELRRLENRCAGLGVSIASAAKRHGDDPNATLLGTGRVSGRAANKQAKRADVADRMPALGRALHAGEVSGEHVDAVVNATAGLSDAEASLVFEQLGNDIAEAAERQPVDTFRRSLRSTIDRCRADHGEAKLAEQRKRSSLKRWIADDGMGHLHLTVDPERFSSLSGAIERQARQMAAAAKGDGPGVSVGPALELDALIELVNGAQGPLGRPTITVIVDHDTMATGPNDQSVCETDDGHPLPITTVQRMVCDSVVNSVGLDATGRPLDVGRRFRTATDAQWIAAKAIYASCAWFGCERPITWCQLHHIHEWEAGGPTDFANLVPLCSQHHHQVHEGGWRLVMRPDRTLEIHRPAARPPNEAQRPPGRPAPPNQASLWHTTTPDRRPSAPRQRIDAASTIPPPALMRTG